jgi:long-subunit acyl-CoA synthetase (AMP-forming)
MGLMAEALGCNVDCGIAVDDGRTRLSHVALRDAVNEARSSFAAMSGRRFALLADNGAGWVVADLALHLERLPNVPLPAFFTDAQLRHALDDAGVDVLLTDDPQRASRLLPHWLNAGTLRAAGLDVRLRPGRDSGRPPLPAGTVKVTYTSGSTDTPKGVCLGAAQLESVARSLVEVTRALDLRRHLCVLPLSTLLENIAGLYAPLAVGATCLVPHAALDGTNGGQLNALRLLDQIAVARPDSVILVPELLRMLVTAAESGWKVPSSLRFVAVGGAPVAPDLLVRAAEVGLPVYEGYGLSECASVVCLNTPEARRVGTVGRPLPHVRLRVDERGELHVRGATTLGYLGGAPCAPGAELATGDLGMVDSDGYVRVHGRLRTVYITSLGRNVSPEWVEREIAAESGIGQVLVHGEARPYAVALVVPAGPTVAASVIADSIATANMRLPEYARVRRWARVPARFAPENGLMTGNGRLRRDAIVGRYGGLLESMYRDTESVQRAARA